ncbi:MAG: sulfatase-like hydrolase/transferase [Rhodospirillaceae bacterium]|nr:sulfatase-like hydrolase/transferase [Rhodospirillaceae bacterium]
MKHTSWPDYGQLVAMVVLAVFGPPALAQESAPYQPNILVIISDDQGVVDSPEYHYDPNPPHTPNLSALANEGVIFENAWATPMCFTTRAAYLTGLHGARNGVLTGNTPIRLEDQTIYEFLRDNEETGNYASAFIGKWYVGLDDVNGESYPVANGVPYFAGVIEGNFGAERSYDRWNLTIDSPEMETVRVVSTEYNTSKLTRLAEEWIEEQDSPWFVTLAYNAPHGPRHWPDESLHGMQERTEKHFTSDMCGGGGMGAMGAGAAEAGSMGAGGAAGSVDDEECYNAMVEAMDTEVGNLLLKLEELGQRDETLIIYSGDNGSSEPTVIEDRQAKSTLYAGGLHVPFFASGAGVTRKGVREDRLVTITDIFATVGEIAGADFDGTIHDSLSFAGFLSSEEGIDRPYAFSDIDRNNTSGWSVRDHEHMLMRLNGEDTLFEINPDNFMYKDVTASEPEILRMLQQAGERINRGD